MHKGIIRHPGTAQRYWTFSLSSRSRKLACLLCSSFIFKYSIPEASQTHGFIQSDLGIETAFLADRPDSLLRQTNPSKKGSLFLNSKERLGMKKTELGQTRSKCINVTIAAATRHSSQLRWFAKLCTPSRLVKSPQLVHAFRSKTTWHQGQKVNAHIPRDVDQKDLIRRQRNCHQTDTAVPPFYLKIRRANLVTATSTSCWQNTPKHWSQRPDPCSPPNN